ncbi:MAG: CbtB-domain containing protein, partial [Actinomycetota bacterium]|nr:CbtB-domain containing protein [Actinomycetota bacterium]
PLGWSTALLRHLYSYVSALALGIGYLWMLWDPEKQTWHDKWSSTLENGTTLRAGATVVHELFHDGRHFLGVPCH